MKISIFGLGYVGAVSAGCFARDGHEVIGVDPVQSKVDMINQGRSPIIEKDIDQIIKKCVIEKRLKATDEAVDAIKNTDISFVCVGTPSKPNGDLNLVYVERVCSDIGNALHDHSEYHAVVIRSTILPGTMKRTVIPTLEKTSGKKPGIDFGVCNNPEFLREGSAVYDFDNPPKTVIGQFDSKSGEDLTRLYQHLDAPLIKTDLETAEMVKYVDNVWHALKVGFANEVGNICKALNIDSHHVMDIFCKDTKLNISSSYLKPGFAFGGSCLPKDLRALTYKAKMLDLELPILNSIMFSNSLQVKKGLKMIMARGNKKVGVLGFSFKAGTDDLRESPIVEVIERLLGKGYDIRIFDRNVKLASLIGANREFILNVIPHVSNLMVDSIDEVLDHAETIVVGNEDPHFKNILQSSLDGRAVVDFVRIQNDMCSHGNYDGICW